MKSSVWPYLGLAMAAALLASQPPAAAGPAVVQERSDISRYRALWEEPLFALPATAGQPEPSGSTVDPEAANLRLAGWGESGGMETAVAFNCNTLETFLLDASVDPAQGRPILLQLERGDAQQTPRALVEWKGRTFWIHTAQPASTPANIQPNSVVDSRAARLRSPVLLTNDATMDDWTGDTSRRKPGESRIQELRERHRRLQQMFGR